jgi:hypothetical protein
MASTNLLLNVKFTKNELIALNEQISENIKKLENSEKIEKRDLPPLIDGTFLNPDIIFEIHLNSPIYLEYSGSYKEIGGRDFDTIALCYDRRFFPKLSIFYLGDKTVGFDKGIFVSDTGMYKHENGSIRFDISEIEISEYLECEPNMNNVLKLICSYYEFLLKG